MAAAGKDVKRVLVTGAAGQIAYSLIPLIADGQVFGNDQPVILHLLDIPQAEAALEGVVMEIQDGAYPLVQGIVATVDVQTAFTDVDVAILVGGFPRLAGMDRSDLLEKNANIFQTQGKALNDYAKPTTKVLVVANPANTNCLIAATNAPKIPKENFSALTRLDQNRAVGAVAKEFQVTPGQVKDVFIWGNHSNTMVPYLSQAQIQDAEGNWKALAEDARLSTEFQESFVPFVQTRGAAVIKARGKSSAMSAANAVKDHLRDWILPGEGKAASMAVWTDGTKYGLEKGLYFSLPVRCGDGQYTVVEGLKFTEEEQKMIKATEQELIDERRIADVKLE